MGALEQLQIIKILSEHLPDTPLAQFLEVACKRMGVNAEGATDEMVLRYVLDFFAEEDDDEYEEE